MSCKQEYVYRELTCEGKTLNPLTSMLSISDSSDASEYLLVVETWHKPTGKKRDLNTCNLNQYNRGKVNQNELEWYI